VHTGDASDRDVGAQRRGEAGQHCGTYHYDGDTAEYGGTRQLDGTQPEWGRTDQSDADHSQRHLEAEIALSDEPERRDGAAR
jgi:hypothetical protein